MERDLPTIGITSENPGPDACLFESRTINERRDDRLVKPDALVAGAFGRRLRRP
jgi:hypothetical protein